MSDEKKKPKSLHQDYEKYLADNSHWAAITMKTTRNRLAGFPTPLELTPAWFRKRMTEISPATAKAEKVLILSFLRWRNDLTEKEINSWGLKPWKVVEVKVWKKVRPPKFKGEITHKDIYKADELLKIIAACTHPRDAALVQVLYESGARKSEIVGVQFADVEFKDDDEAILSLEGKTGTRQVPIMESVPALRDWMNLHPYGKGAIWLSHRRKQDEDGNLVFLPLSGSQLYGIVKALVEKAGLDRSVRRVVHMFRHTRATDFVRMDVRGTALNRLMGWKDGSHMEAIYVHLAFEDVENEVRAKVFGKGEKALPPESPMKAILCPKCDTLNSVGARLCQKCNAFLSLKDALEKLDRQPKVELSGLILQELLDNPEESFMDEYIATHGEIVEKLLQPIVNKMVAKALARERKEGH